MKKMLLIFGLLLLAGSISFAFDEKCDLNKSNPKLFCEDCNKILQDNEVLNKEWCKECNKDKKPDEMQKAKKVQVCIKKYYYCEHCDEDKTKTFKPGTHCGKKMTEKTDMALIIYKCENCGKEAEKEGKCDEEDCKKAGKKIVKTCEKSGEFPHVKESEDHKHGGGHQK